MSILEVADQKKSKKKTTTIYEIMEPDSLARGFYTEKDDMIKQKDEPERFQLRGIPVRDAEGTNDDMIEESNFIYKNAFDNLTISKQMVSPEEASTRKPPTCVDKIQDILSFIRNEHFDIPYIAFYRKEYIEPHLDIHDIYKIYHCDEFYICREYPNEAQCIPCGKMQYMEYQNVRFL